MKRLAVYLIILAVLLASCRHEKPTAEAAPTDTIPLLVTQIQRCSRLYTAEYKMHKIVIHNDTKRLEGSLMSKKFSVELPLGKRKVAIPIDATAKAYIDMDGFSANNVRRNGDKIEIILPDPRLILTSTRINHDEVKQYVPLLRGDFTDEELTSYERQGRDQILQSLPRVVETARLNAASTLIPMIEQLGYKPENIRITFRKNFTLSDIRQFIVDRTTVENNVKDNQ